MGNPSSHHANSSKRRQGPPDLSRSGSTPSHRSKIAQIFQDAALEIASPSRRLPPNTARSRHPLEGAINMPYSLKECRTSSRAATPPDLQFDKIFPTPEFPYDNHEKDILSLSPGFDEYEEECHSSHGVPLVISAKTAQTSKPNNLVDAWLEEVLAHSPHPGSKEKVSVSTVGRNLPLPQTPKKPIVHTKTTPSRRVSNKENIAPSTAALSWSDLDSPRQADASSQPSFHRSSSTSSRKSSMVDQNTLISASYSQQADQLRGILKLPPEHKNATDAVQLHTKDEKPRTPITFSAKISNSGGRLYFESCDDVEPATPVGLSPDVECFRKGKGPKRVRCPSYYDQDIFPELAPTAWKGKSNGGKGGVGKGRQALNDRKDIECRKSTEVEMFVKRHGKSSV